MSSKQKLERFYFYPQINESKLIHFEQEQPHTPSRMISKALRKFGLCLEFETYF